MIKQKPSAYNALIVSSLMQDKIDNPFSSPIVSTTVSKSPVKNGMRILSGAVSIVIFLFGFAGYISWATADFYSKPKLTHYHPVLAATVLLLLIAAYWMFFSLVGHKLISKNVNYLTLIISLILVAPTCIFVALIFM